RGDTSGDGLRGGERQRGAARTRTARLDAPPAGRSAVAPIAAHRSIRRGVLLFALLAALALPEVFARPSVAVAFGVTPPASDFLYAQPADGLSPAALSTALGRLGFAAEDVRADGVRIEVGGTLPQALA